MSIQRALIVKKYWLDKIFDEGKVWEMRSSRTKVNELIWLIESGSGLIVGEVVLYGCGEALTKDQAINTKHLHKVEDIILIEKWKYPWFLKDSKRYNNPIPYKHPKGAVIWVKFDEIEVNKNEY